MPLQLRNGLYYAVHSDDVILMDIEQDRFFALPRHMCDAFVRLCDMRDATAADIQVLKPLVDQKILLPTDRPLSSKRIGCATVQGSIQTEGQSHTLFLGVQALFYRVRVAVWLRIYPLHKIVARLQTAKRHIAEEPQRLPEPAMLAAAFKNVESIIAVKDRCLPANIALAAMLFRHGITATFILAVRTGPFAAHCWVQIGDQLLNESQDNILGFSPILVI